MTKLQDRLRNHYLRDRAGYVHVPQSDAEKIAARLDLLEERTRDLLEWQDWAEWTEGCGGLVSDMNRARAALEDNQQKGED